MSDKGDAARFERFDAQQDPSYFIKFLDARKAIPEDALIKRQIIDWLQPLEGRQVLDVCCGTGDDSREIARIVGPKGHVMAIDFSAAMITEARNATRISLCRSSFMKETLRISPLPTPPSIVHELNAS